MAPGARGMLASSTPLALTPFGRHSHLAAVRGPRHRAAVKRPAGGTRDQGAARATAARRRTAETLETRPTIARAASIGASASQGAIPAARREGAGERREERAAAELDGALGPAHRPARRLDPERLGLGRAVADHERSEQGEQRQAELAPIVVVVERQAADEEELPVAIDGRVEERRRARVAVPVARATSPSSASPSAAAVASAPPTPRWPSASAAPAAAPSAERDRGDPSAESPARDARPPERLEAPVAHHHQRACRGAATPRRVDAGEAGRARERQPMAQYAPRRPRRAPAGPRPRGDRWQSSGPAV